MKKREQYKHNVKVLNELKLQKLQLRQNIKKKQKDREKLHKNKQIP